MRDRWTSREGGRDTRCAEAREEVILLPSEERSAEHARRWAVEDELVMLEVFPNPTDGLAYVFCNVPEGGEQALMRLRDLQGRIVREQRLGKGMSIVEVDLVPMALGVYIAELRSGGVVIGQAKVTRQ